MSESDIDIPEVYMLVLDSGKPMLYLKETGEFLGGFGNAHKHFPWMTEDQFASYWVSILNQMYAYGCH